MYCDTNSVMSRKNNIFWDCDVWHNRRHRDLKIRVLTSSPPKTNLGLRPWHDPIVAFVEGSVVLGSRGVKGREDVAILRHYVTQLDPHDVFAHFNVVHHLLAPWANHLPRCNLFQLFAGHHSMQEYARRVLSQNMFGMMRWQSSKA